MFGSQITSWVSISRPQVVPSDIPLLGRPVIPPNFLYVPERAGEKISWWMWIKFIFMVALPNIRSVLNNLPARVDPRLEAVRFFFFFVLIHCKLRLLHSQFIHQLKEQKKYEKIGAVGCALQLRNR